VILNAVVHDNVDGICHYKPQQSSQNISTQSQCCTQLLILEWNLFDFKVILEMQSQLVAGWETRRCV